MGIGKKWGLQSSLFAVIATLLLLLVLNLQLRQHGIDQAEEKAKLILQEKQAAITYIVKDLRPPLFELIKQQNLPSSYFDPSWMSATYINRIIMTYFNDSEFDTYYFKNAAVNARSPENEANAYEKAFLEKVTADPAIESKSDIIDIDGNPFFIYMQRQSSTYSEDCLLCHGTPDNAPQDLITLYGSSRSFDKKIGEVPSILSLRIPLAKVYSSINALTLILSVFIASILAFIFFLQWFLVKRNIIGPIKIITAKSSAIASDESLLGKRITIAGNGELAEMARAFSDMSEKLALSKDNLEDLVAERTRELQESRDQAQNYLDFAGVMFIAIDRTGKIILINPKGCAILGITKENALGLNWFDHFIPKPMVADVKSVFSQLLRGEIGLVKYYENPIITTAGEERIIAFRNSILKDSKGEITGILWAGEDITEKKLLEEEARKLGDQLRQSHKMEAIGTLAGGIAHDFNNILAAIIGYADMAQDDIPPENPAKHHIQQVLKASHRAKDLVRQILAFSRKEACERIPLQIQPILKEGLKLLRASLPSTIEIRQDIDPECGTILADPTEIHQVVMNLCTNSAQAMEDTEGVIDITLTTINITTDHQYLEPKIRPGSYIQLIISDNGIGIDPKDVERIFDPYFTTKEIGKGSGMGLAVVKGIVQSHDGIIAVESSPETGTSFKIYFPEIAEVPPNQENEAPPLPAGNEKILIVDDEESLAAMLKRSIGKLGYSTTAAMSSVEALELFRAQPDAFDLVITDQTMPHLTGEQLAQELLKIRPGLPILLCSGFSPKMDREKALAIGIKAFIAKPVSITELATTIREVLNEA